VSGVSADVGGWRELRHADGTVDEPAQSRDPGATRRFAQSDRAGRTMTYGPYVIVALERCWAVLRAPAGKRIASRGPVGHGEAPQV
jgi:hypothetical protein